MCNKNANRTSDRRHIEKSSANAVTQCLRLNGRAPCRQSSIQMQPPVPNPALTVQELLPTRAPIHVSLSTVRRARHPKHHPSVIARPGSRPWGRSSAASIAAPPSVLRARSTPSTCRESAPAHARLSAATHPFSFHGCSSPLCDIARCRHTVTPVVKRSPRRTDTMGMHTEHILRTKQSRRYTRMRSRHQFIPTAHRRT